MYETPKLVRFGKFRDLTLQAADCTTGVPKPWVHKVNPSFDAALSSGINDGCPTARS